MKKEIDIFNLNEEDLENLSEKELNELALIVKDNMVFLDAEQHSIKIAINSMYGVFANKYFHFFSLAHAMTITGIGRHLIQKTEVSTNKYFLEKWHLDTKLHAAMGLTSVEPIKNPVSVYGDTDSLYFSVGEVYKNTKGWKKQGDDLDSTRFFLDIYNKRIKNYYIKFFDLYCKKYGADPIFDFELENISRNAIFLERKKYVLDISWEDDGKDGIFHHLCKKMKYSGGDVKQSSTPKWVKEKLKETIIWMIRQPEIKAVDLMKLISNIKEEYFLLDIDDIAKTIKVNNYEKYVISDGEEIQLVKGTPSNVRSASLYNHLLRHKNKKLMNKYDLIKSGDQVKYYQAEINLDGFNIFAYLPNSYPIEFAPPIDKKTQFEKSFIDPINQYIRAIGLNPINPNLFVTIKLF